MNRTMPTVAGPAQIIAEVAQAHDGSLGMAHAYIEAVARAGASAVKFQTHIASAESTRAEPWRVAFSAQDQTRYDYWKRIEFTEAQWHGLRQHADDAGLLFLSSPFSLEAVELLARVGVAAWKIASGEVANSLLLERMARTRLPILLSTGMSPWLEIDRAVSQIKSHHLPLTVMQCTSSYPCPPEKIGLNLLSCFRDRYACRVGLSDHSGTIFPGLAAATLGADVIEVHVTLSREAFGPDVPASVTTDELRQLVAGVRFIEQMRAHPIDKDLAAGEMASVRRIFHKSLVAKCNLPAGTVLEAQHVACKKPGSGLAPDRLPEFLGRKLRRSVLADALLCQEDLE